MSKISDLIKAGHSKGGEPLFKGDIPGHEFHGNQYTTAASEAKRLSDVANNQSSTILRNKKAQDAAVVASWTAASIAPTEELRTQHLQVAEKHTVRANKLKEIIRANAEAKEGK